MITGCPAAFASSGDSPTLTISGSVNTIAGTATGSYARFLPAIISATISPWKEATCANISPELQTSPIAYTPLMFVSHLSFTLTNPLSSSATPVGSNALLLGFLPTVTSILSAMISSGSVPSLAFLST